MTIRDYVREMRATRRTNGVRTTATDVRALAMLCTGRASWALSDAKIWPFGTQDALATKHAEGGA